MTLLLAPGPYEAAVAVGMPTAHMAAMLSVIAINDAKTLGRCVGDGKVDDSAKISALDTFVTQSAGFLSFSPGVYRIAQSIALSAALWMDPGAILRPDNGVTITLNGPLNAGLQQIFDTSTGGTVLVNSSASLFVVAEWWGAVGRLLVDDSAPIQSAIASLATAGGRVQLLDKNYYAGDLALLPYVEFHGIGNTRIKKLPTSTYLVSVQPGGGASPNPANNYKRIRVRDLWLEGNSAGGFFEFGHCLNVNGVTDFIVERVRLTSFEGDGLILGSTNVGGLEAHNLDVTVRDCEFDGVNRLNRNGISVIDCNRLLVENCKLSNIGFPGMPGGIDVEPDGHSFSIIHDLTFRKIAVSACPNVAGIALNFAEQSILTTPASKVLLEDFTVDGCAVGWGMSGETSGSGATAATPAYDVTIRDGKITNCAVPFSYDGAKGLTVEDCEYEDNSQQANLGYTPLRVSRDVVMRQIVTRRGGLTTVDAWQIRTFDGLTIEKCTFEDCGIPAGGGGRALHFMTGNTGSRLFHNWNTYTSPLGRTTYVIAVDAGFTLNNDSSEDRTNLVYFATNYDLLARFSSKSAMPVTGTWSTGALITNTNPAVGGPIGWVYVTASGGFRPYGAVT